MHRIVTACFDREGNRVEPDGVCPVYDTGSVWLTFSIAKPAINNTRVDMSPYGQSVFAGAVDAIQVVDLCYDAMMPEIDNGKMRVFLSDVMFDVERDGKGGRVSIPLGRQNCTVFRKVMSTKDTIHEFAAAAPGSARRHTGPHAAPLSPRILSLPGERRLTSVRAGPTGWNERGPRLEDRGPRHHAS